MNKHYSILHISDLHKGENNDFDHLFASLCNDADSYDQDIPKPEFTDTWPFIKSGRSSSRCLVNGDIS